MSRKARNGKAYKFTKKRHSGKGVAALALSFVPLILFFYAVAYSFMEGGNAPREIGGVGPAAVLLAIGTLRMSIKEAGKENVIKKEPIAGAVMSVFMILGWGAVYVIGWIGV